MRDHPDAIALLDALADHDGDGAYDPDSPSARASLEGILASPRGAAHAPRVPRRPPRRLVFAAVGVALAAVALAVVPSLGGGPRAATAQAAVLERAAAALEQPGSIVDLQVSVYAAHGSGCFVIILGLDDCVQGASPDAAAGISADPAADTLTTSYQEWLSPDGSVDRTLYAGGDEAVRNSATLETVVYDPAVNVLTTLTGTEGGATPQVPGADRAPIPSISDFQDPSYYESLYQQALAGTQNVTLVGQTTLGGESVYELRFEIDPAPPANPPAGDMCGSTVCQPPQMTFLLYVDSQTFLPVRCVNIVTWPAGAIGVPAGSTVESVTDYSAQSLPDTAANQSLLAMSPHPGASLVTETQAQARADIAAQIEAMIGASQAQTQTGSAQPTGAALVRRRARSPR